MARGRGLRLEMAPYYQLSDAAWTPLALQKLNVTVNEHQGRLQQLGKQISFMDPERNKDALESAKKQYESVQAVLKELEELRKVFVSVHEKARLQYRLVHRVGDQDFTLTSTLAADTK